jgi:hypothetical protein
MFVPFKFCIGASSLTHGYVVPSKSMVVPIGIDMGPTGVDVQSVYEISQGTRFPALQVILYLLHVAIYIL